MSVLVGFVSDFCKVVRTRWHVEAVMRTAISRERPPWAEHFANGDIRILWKISFALYAGVGLFASAVTLMGKGDLWSGMERHRQR